LYSASQHVHPGLLLDLVGSRQVLASLRCKLVQAESEETLVALRLIGVDPNSPNNGSPTVWVDDPDGDIVVQGWKIVDEKTLTAIAATGPVPDHETVLRLPARMAPLLREAIGNGGADVV
jgi:hypothetical protein